MHLLLLDANNLLCRMYFANPKMQIDGQEVGGIYALGTYIQNLVKLLQGTHIALAQDLGKKTWRHSLFPAYKQNRGSTEPDLRTQFPLIKPLARLLDVQLIGQEDFEADDCLATLATQAHKHVQVTIISTDKDLYQLSHPNITIYNPHYRKNMNTADIEAKYQTSVNRLIDYFTLVGDTSDNLPGIPGIGPKTALQILEKCDCLDQLDSHLQHFTPNTARKLQNQQEQIALMRQMITLVKDVPVTIPFTPETSTYFEWHGGEQVINHQTIKEIIK